MIHQQSRTSVHSPSLLSLSRVTSTIIWWLCGILVYIFLITILTRWSTPEEFVGTVLLAMMLSLFTLTQASVLSTLTWHDYLLAFLTHTPPSPPSTHFSLVLCRLSLLGAWIMSVYLPLDAETSLQRWPYASLIGCLGGAFLTCLYTAGDTMIHWVKKPK